MFSALRDRVKSGYATVAEKAKNKIQEKFGGTIGTVSELEQELERRAQQATTSALIRDAIKVWREKIDKGDYGRYTSDEIQGFFYVFRLNFGFSIFQVFFF